MSGQSGLRPLSRSRRPRSPLEWQQCELELPKGCTDRRSSFQNIAGDARSPSGSGPASLLFPVSPPPRRSCGGPRPPPPSTGPGLTPTSPNSEGHRGPGSPTLPGKGCERQPCVGGKLRAMSVWQEIITAFEINLGQNGYDFVFNWQTLPDVFSLD